MTLYGVLFKAQSGDTELDPQNNEKLPVSLTEGKVRYGSCHHLIVECLWDMYTPNTIQ